jgi:hypothetical protein
MRGACQKFWKVSSLVHLLNKRHVEGTFENVCRGIVLCPELPHAPHDPGVGAAREEPSVEGPCPIHHRLENPVQLLGAQVKVLGTTRHRNYHVWP